MLGIHISQNCHKLLLGQETSWWAVAVWPAGQLTEPGSHSSCMTRPVGHYYVQSTKICNFRNVGQIGNLD